MSPYVLIVGGHYYPKNQKDRPKLKGASSMVILKSDLKSFNFKKRQIAVLFAVGRFKNWKGFFV